MINDGKGDEVVETLLGHLFFLYIKYNRDLSFISAGFLGEVGLSFDYLNYYISFSSKRASRSTLINENPDKNKSSFRM